MSGVGSDQRDEVGQPGQGTSYTPAELRVIESVWGHRAGGPNSDPKDIAFVEQAIRDLLARPDVA